MPLVPARLISQASLHHAKYIANHSSQQPTQIGTHILMISQGCNAAVLFMNVNGQILSMCQNVGCNEDL